MLSKQSDISPFIDGTLIDEVKNEDMQRGKMDGFAMNSSYVISFGQIHQLVQRPVTRKSETQDSSPRLSDSHV